MVWVQDQTFSGLSTLNSRCPSLALHETTKTTNGLAIRGCGGCQAGGGQAEAQSLLGSRAEGRVMVIMFNQDENTSHRSPTMRMKVSVDMCTE